MLTFEQNKLRRVLLRSELLKRGEALQSIAYATPGRNRAIFTPGALILGWKLPANLLFESLA